MNWLNNLLGGKPSREEFAKTVCKFVAETKLHGKPRFDADQFAVICTDDAGVVTCTMNLANAYDDYCRAPKDERKQLLTAYFTLDFKEPETLDDAIVNIMARLQPRIFFESIALSDFTQNQTPDKPKLEFPNKPFAEHFAISLVVDNPRQVSYLSNDTLNKWGTTLGELLPRAIINLTRITPEPFQPLQDGVYYSHYADTHDASRLLVLHRVNACRLKGRPVAFTPNRNTLLITGENDKAGLEYTIKLVQEALKEPRPMPVFPLILDKGESGEEWKLWNVPKDHPCEADLYNLSMMSFADLYAEQKALLDKKYEKEGIDVFVSTLKVMSHKDEKKYMSFSTWSESVPTYLPESNNIGLVALKGDKAEHVFMATWEAVQSVMGAKMLKQDLYPTRYFVDCFPDAEQLALIKKLGEV